MAVTEAPAVETGVGGIRGLEPLLYVPFMLHVLLVLVIVWISSSLHFNSFILLGLCFAYLFQIEKRGREKEHRRIAHEERKKLNTKKALTEGETLRWLNEALKTIWPICMQNFVSKHFFGPMAPWFLNAYKPWSVKGVTLQSLNLGENPPTFSLIRVLDLPMEEDHVVFEAAMEFVSGHDMSAVMSVQMIRRFGGFSTSFYISNLHIEGTVKFSVKFEEGWPVIGRVRFCFAKAPYVTMTARPLYKTALDVNLIPGAANWLERTIALALEQSVVEPNLLVVDMKMLVSNMMFPDLRTQPPKPNGNDFFYVESKWASPVVRVEIVEATDLKAVDSNVLPDPFVEIKLGPTNKKTATKKKTLNPKWNETHRLPVVNWDLPNQLILRVRDKGHLFGSDELGACSVAIKEYRDGLRHELTLPLLSVTTGHLKVAITLEHSNQGIQTFEEPRSSGAGSQPVTQEIQTNGTAANNSSPGWTSSAVMKRSSSETQLTRHPLKQKRGKQHNRNSSAGTIPCPAAPQEQNFNGETSESIAMPYGPSGAFAIHHPGKIVPTLFPTRPTQGIMRKQKASAIGNPDDDLQAEQVRSSWKSMLNIFGRRHRRNGTSHESLPAERETNPSETGYTSSLDQSMELRVNGTEPYSGNVKMNLVPPDSKSLAPEEPPDIFVGPPPQLAPILSNQDRELTEAHAPEVQELSANSLRSIMNGQDSTIVSGSFSFRSLEVGVVSEQPNEKQYSKNKTIFEKMKNKLTKRSVKKKRRSKGTGHSTLTEGIYADGVSPSQRLLYTSEQSGASASHSFRRESSDLKKIMNSSHSRDSSLRSIPERTLIKLGLSDKP